MGIVKREAWSCWTNEEKMIELIQDCICILNTIMLGLLVLRTFNKI
jgi:hypothetical protein